MCSVRSISRVLGVYNFEFTMKKWCRVSEKSPSILFLFPMRTTNTMQWGEIISMEHFYFKPTIKLTGLSLLQFFCGGIKQFFRTKVCSPYHLCVECFSQLSFISEMYTKSAAVANFAYISE